MNHIKKFFYRIFTYGTTIILLGTGTYSLGYHEKTISCKQKRFKVTAYYSPLPGQNFYYRGNYDDEVILNGFGTHGASGKGVFHGMFAGPPSYEFGTQIYLPGRGAGEIADRGGAIVEQGKRKDATYDRIDIRVGKGEQGLQRALSFGVQYIDGYICPANTFSYEELGIDYEKIPKYTNFFHSTLWILSLWPERKDPRVKALQEYLIALGYMKNGRDTGYYGNETKSAVCRYQQDRLGLNKESKWCGYFGPQTRYNMKQTIEKLGLSIPGNTTLKGEYNQKISKNKQSATQGYTASSIKRSKKNNKSNTNKYDTNNINTQEGSKISKISQKTYTKKTTKMGKMILQNPSTLDERIIHHMFTKGEFKNYFFLSPMKKGDKGKEVRILQRKLQFLGYLDTKEEISGIYDNKTIQAVYQFQLDNHIITGDEDMTVRGYLGKKTRDALNKK